MTHDPKDTRGTVAELRNLLSRATPGPWRAFGCRHRLSDEMHLACAIHAPGLDGASDIGGGHSGVGVVRDTNRDECCHMMDGADAALIAALRNAAPDLLRVVEAVAKLDEFARHGECPICAQHVSNQYPFGHLDDCAWLLARKLTGGAT